MQEICIDEKGKNDYHSGVPILEGEEVSTEAGIDKLLTVQEVCELLRVKKNYVYWLTHQKKIPFIKMQGHLRFRQSAIDEWLDLQEVASAGKEETI